MECTVSPNLPLSGVLIRSVPYSDLVHLGPGVNPSNALSIGPKTGRKLGCWIFCTTDNTDQALSRAWQRPRASSSPSADLATRHVHITHEVYANICRRDAKEQKFQNASSVDFGLLCLSWNGHF